MLSAEEEIARQLKNKTAQKVELKILKEALEFMHNKTSSNNLFLSENIYFNYKEYYEVLNLLEEYKMPFLEILEEQETISNQSLEKISPLVVDLYLKKGHLKPTKFLEDIYNYNLEFSETTFLNTHSLILFGQERDENKGLRTDNGLYVGYRESNHHKIDYIALDYNEIPEVLNFVVDLYNDKTVKDINDLFVKPVLLHGVIAACQMFKDGNTRLARIYQSLKLWQLSNESEDLEIYKKPIIYISEAVEKSNSRREYRHLIKEIAVNPSPESFNNWYQFNLELIDKQIYSNRNKVGEIVPTLNKIIK